MSAAEKKQKAEIAEAGSFKKQSEDQRDADLRRQGYDPAKMKLRPK